MVDLKQHRRPARRRGRADLHRLAGRADGGAVADGQPRPPASASARATPCVLASSLIPGNENAVYRVINGLDPLGREGRAQGQRDGARLRPRQRRRAALLLQHRAAEQRHAGPRRVAAPAGQRRPRRRDRRRRATGSCSPRTASWSTSSTAGARSSAAVPCGYVYVDGSSVGDVTEASLKDRRILGDEGFISVVVVVDSVTGKVAGGPEIHARGFAEDDAVFDEVRPQIEEALAKAASEGDRRHPPAPAGRPPGGRPLGQRHLPPPADDHPASSSRSDRGARARPAVDGCAVTRWCDASRDSA